MSSKIKKYEISREGLYYLDENNKKKMCNSCTLTKIKEMSLITEGEEIEILKLEESKVYGLREGLRKIINKCEEKNFLNDKISPLLDKKGKHYGFIINEKSIMEKRTEIKELDIIKDVNTNKESEEEVKVYRYSFECKDNENNNLSVNIDFKLDNSELGKLHKIVINGEKFLNSQSISKEGDWRVFYTINQSDGIWPGITKLAQLYCEGSDDTKFVVNLVDDNNNSGKKTKNSEETYINMKNEYESIETRIKKLIDKEMYQIILTGAPGTGKTYTAKQVAKSYSNKETEIFKEKDKNGTVKMVNYRLVQFHPSYDYTDFVEGIRPIEVDGNMIFKKFDGIFKEFCRKVAIKNINNKKYLKYKYFFIIDEINRADLSKVLGELMLGLEKDKRGEPIITQYSNIKETYGVEQGVDEKGANKDVFANGFFIPENVVIIGTMNDIDRSVESMDFALRRRFTWVEVDVDLEGKSLTEAFKDKEKFCPQIQDDNKRKIIVNRICALNKVISENGKSEGDKLGLNKHYYVSQGYFTGIPNNDDETNDKEKLLKWVWEYRLKSLLEEYVRGEESNKFIKDCEEAFLKDKSGNDTTDKSTEHKNDSEPAGK